MSRLFSPPFRLRRWFLALAAPAALGFASLLAADRPSGSSGGGASDSAMVNLVARLTERGLLSKEDAAALVKQATDEAAQARVQLISAQVAAMQSARNAEGRQGAGTTDEAARVRTQVAGDPDAAERAARRAETAAAQATAQVAMVQAAATQARKQSEDTATRLRAELTALVADRRPDGAVAPSGAAGDSDSTARHAELLAATAAAQATSAQEAVEQLKRELANSLARMRGELAAAQTGRPAGTAAGVAVTAGASDTAAQRAEARAAAAEAAVEDLRKEMARSLVRMRGEMVAAQVARPGANASVAAAAPENADAGSGRTEKIALRAEAQAAAAQGAVAQLEKQLTDSLARMRGELVAARVGGGTAVARTDEPPVHLDAGTGLAGLGDASVRRAQEAAIRAASEAAAARMASEMAQKDVAEAISRMQADLAALRGAPATGSIASSGLPERGPAAGLAAQAAAERAAERAEQAANRAQALLAAAPATGTGSPSGNELVERWRADALAAQAAAEKAAQRAELAASRARATTVAAQAADRTGAPAGSAVAGAPATGQPGAAAEETEATGDDTVRVTYVPEIVKAQLREEIKQEVMTQAKAERWAAPRSFPEWVSRFKFFADYRLRSEALLYPQGNDAASLFNYNAINTGSPYDVSQSSNPLGYPTYNVDQDRRRFRLQARLGLAADLGEGFDAGLRIGTGENNSPVSQNQSLGAAGSGAGGSFSKYSLWLDRAFLRYTLGGNGPDSLAITTGRMDKPFMSTNAIWHDDIGFDGLTVEAKHKGTGNEASVTLGAYPVFNTDLNYGTNGAGWPGKYQSMDKWLFAGQVGAGRKIADDLSFKVGFAYYYFQNVEGQVSSPRIPISAADAFDTDASRPAFAQKGNTYIALRDITPDSSANANGTTNQWQYFGLATPFHVLAADVRLDYDRFAPFRISLFGEYLKNRAFDRAAILANGPSRMRGPQNNIGATASDFLGGDSGWIAGLRFGDAAIEKRWDWNFEVSYRRLQSDAVIDAFTDPDFGGGGTNLKGFGLRANLGLSSRVWLTGRWTSASEAAGATFKNDTVQLDLNGKF